MKYMIGSGFSTEIYEWIWFSKILQYMKKGGGLKISAVSTGRAPPSLWAWANRII
jgi:hypothetical protein